MSLDEIVALNVASLIEERGSITQVAEHLGVSRAHVYDMTRARPGRAQREFRWSEIVNLASLFRVLVFDLVLPPEGVVLARGEWITGLYDGGSIDSVPDEELGDIEMGALGRSDVSLALFGLPGEYLKLETLRSMRRHVERAKEEREQLMDDKLKGLMRAIEEMEEQRRMILEELG